MIAGVGEGDRTKWNAIYAARASAAELPAHAELLDRVASHLPSSGRALDLAGGAGRNGLWLAERGLAVTVADISPVGLALAAAAAERRGLAITTLAWDFDDGFAPGVPWDVVLAFHFLDRRLLGSVDSRLSSGGVFVFCQPTQRNLERHDKPSARYLLQEGELAALVSASLEVIHYREGWSAEGRHEAELVARLPHFA